MKVRCQIIEEQDALMPDIDDCRNAFVWKCRDCAPGGTQDSIFVYELTAWDRYDSSILEKESSSS